MTGRTLSSLALLLAIALGIAPSPVQSTVATPRGAPDIGSRTGGRVHSAGTTPALLGKPHPAAVSVVGPSVGGRASRTGLAAAPTAPALLTGFISWADPDLGGDYLATRFPRGTLVRLCTPNRCIVRRSNDFGPSAKIDPPRIADLAVLDWESLCGLPRARGVCRGTVEAIDEIALPPTDAAP